MSRYSKEGLWQVHFYGDEGYAYVAVCPICGKKFVEKSYGIAKGVIKRHCRLKHGRVPSDAEVEAHIYPTW